MPWRRERFFIKPDPLVRLVNKRSDLEEDERWLAKPENTYGKIIV